MFLLPAGEGQDEGERSGHPKRVHTFSKNTSKFSTRTSHGMCPECLQNKVAELKANENPPPAPER
jgi:hypothetical protein